MTTSVTVLERIPVKRKGVLEERPSLTPHIHQPVHFPRFKINLYHTNFPSTDASDVFFIYIEKAEK